MPRRSLAETAGLTFHVMNRGVRRLQLCGDDDEYELLLTSFAKAWPRAPVDIFAYCLMPNHFHFVLRPAADGQLAEFMRLGTLRHSRSWHWRRGSVGSGHVYQGRYRAFPIQTERYFLTVCRYVESNALRASLVSRAEEWPWSSFAARQKSRHVLPLCEWPISRPNHWVDVLNEPCADDKFTDIRHSLSHSTPLGEPAWRTPLAERLHLSRGRPGGRPKTNAR